MSPIRDMTAEEIVEYARTLQHSPHLVAIALLQAYSTGVTHGTNETVDEDEKIIHKLFAKAERGAPVETRVNSDNNSGRPDKYSLFNRDRKDAFIKLAKRPDKKPAGDRFRKNVTRLFFGGRSHE